MTLDAILMRIVLIAVVIGLLYAYIYLIRKIIYVSKAKNVCTHLVDAEIVSYKKIYEYEE